jgi:hypothetical protein
MRLLGPVFPQKEMVTKITKFPQLKQRTRYVLECVQLVPEIFQRLLSWVYGLEESWARWSSRNWHLTFQDTYDLTPYLDF